MNNAVLAVPEPLDNETLQRMIDEQIHKTNSEHGPGHGLSIAVLNDLSLYIISDFDFSGLNLHGIFAQRTTFHRCRFIGTDLYHSDFDRTVAPGADFRKAILAKTTFYEADLRGANFDNANLVRTNFMDCDLRGATFRNVDFSGGWASDCNLEGAVYDPQQFDIV